MIGGAVLSVTGMLIAFALLLSGIGSMDDAAGHQRAFVLDALMLGWSILLLTAIILAVRKKTGSSFFAGFMLGVGIILLAAGVCYIIVA